MVILWRSDHQLSCFCGWVDVNRPGFAGGSNS
jgi:hypothetical protein